jgi:hypothetical protein
MELNTKIETKLINKDKSVKRENRTFINKIFALGAIWIVLIVLLASLINFFQENLILISSSFFFPGIILGSLVGIMSTYFISLKNKIINEHFSMLNRKSLDTLSNNHIYNNLIFESTKQDVFTISHNGEQERTLNREELRGILATARSSGMSIEFDLSIDKAYIKSAVAK